MRRLTTGGSCHCAEECDSNPYCLAWTYIPYGILDMGSQNCILRSSVGDIFDDCDGLCRSDEKLTTASPSKSPSTHRNISDSNPTFLRSFACDALHNRKN